MTNDTITVLGGLSGPYKYVYNLNLVSLYDPIDNARKEE